jgi:hypothetical protein
MPAVRPSSEIVESEHLLTDGAKAADEAAHRLAEMIRRRSIPVDVQAADEVKHPR